MSRSAAGVPAGSASIWSRARQIRVQEGIRFHPPKGPLAPGVRWVLSRAFASTFEDIPDALPSECLHEARRLGLLPRILSRHGRELIAAELGDDVARSAAQQLHRQMAAGLAIKQTQQHIAKSALERGFSFGILKFAALYELGFVSPATRAACDLDILVDPEDAKPFAAALISEGYLCPPRRVATHHPFILKSPTGTTVELHTRLPHVRTHPDRPGAELNTLKIAGLVFPSIACSPNVYVPTRELLAAHLVAHGIAQHGFDPRTYPSWRMVSDLAVMGYADDPALRVGAHRWIFHAVSEAELQAIATLIKCLQLDKLEALWESDDDAALLLRHLVYVVTNERYRAQVELRHIGQAVREDGIMSVLRNYSTYALFLPEASLRRIYGDSPRSLLMLRLVRPADFAYRGIRRLMRALPSWRGK